MSSKAHSHKKIYGYLFRILVEKAEHGYVAYCPGVGGVYEEGTTKEEAQKNAYDSATAILNSRWRDGEFLKATEILCC